VCHLDLAKHGDILFTSYQDVILTYKHDMYLLF